MGHPMIRRCLGGNPVFTTMVLAGQNASADISGFVLSEQAAMKGCYWVVRARLISEESGREKPCSCLRLQDWRSTANTLHDFAVTVQERSRRPRKSECAKQKKNPPKVNVSQLTRTARWEWQIGQIQVDSLPILANEKRKLVITPDFNHE